MIASPPTQAEGVSGTLRIGGLRAGVLTKWRVVLSPSTKQPTLFGEGKIARYYSSATGTIVRAELTPAPVPYRIGRPRPAQPRPFVLIGTIAELTGKTITISNGEIERTH
jgi:hypothetical protein